MVSSTRYESTLSGQHPSKHKIFVITDIQRRPNVLNVGPILYKCYTNVLCSLGCMNQSIPWVDLYSYSDIIQRQAKLGLTHAFPH